MNRCLTTLLLSALCAGCVAMPRQPEGAVVRSLHTVAVVPVAEVGTASKPAPRPSTSAGGRGAGEVLLMTPAGLALVFVAMPVVVGKMIADSAAATDEPRTVEAGQVDLAWPTAEFAQATVGKLNVTGGRRVRLADGYLRVAGVTAGFTNPIKCWYAEDVTTVDYAAVGLGTFDGILEVATPLWQEPGERGVLSVLMRLVDPRTRQVLGRARHWTFNVANPGVIKNLLIPPFFLPNAKGEEFVQAVKARGDELIIACLEDLGLTSK